MKLEFKLEAAKKYRDWANIWSKECLWWFRRFFHPQYPVPPPPKLRKRIPQYRSIYTEKKVMKNEFKKPNKYLWRTLEWLLCSCQLEHDRRYSAS